MVFALSDNTPLVQSLCLDSQTGMALRQQERVGRDIVYDRLLTSFETDANLPVTNFATPAGAVIVRGIVSPDVLVSKPKPLDQYAADVSADLLVVGGYGHSRLRELVLGGVTRELLRHMTLPVLMSH